MFRESSLRKMKYGLMIATLVAGSTVCSCGSDLSNAIQAGAIDAIEAATNTFVANWLATLPWF